MGVAGSSELSQGHLECSQLDTYMEVITRRVICKRKNSMKSAALACSQSRKSVAQSPEPQMERVCASQRAPLALCIIIVMA